MYDFEASCTPLVLTGVTNKAFQHVVNLNVLFVKTKGYVWRGQVAMAGLFDSFYKESVLLKKGQVMNLFGFNFYVPLIHSAKKYILVQFLKFRELELMIVSLR